MLEHLQAHWWPGFGFAYGNISSMVKIGTLLHWLLAHCPVMINTLRPRQNGRHFPDDIFKCFFLNENVSIAIKISLKFVPKGPINNIPALVQIMAWRRPGDKPLFEPMMVSLPMHICITRPQWVKKVVSLPNFLRMRKTLLSISCKIFSSIRTAKLKTHAIVFCDFIKDFLVPSGLFVPCSLAVTSTWQPRLTAHCPIGGRASLSRSLATDVSVDSRISGSLEGHNQCLYETTRHWHQHDHNLSHPAWLVAVLTANNLVLLQVLVPLTSRSDDSNCFYLSGFDLFDISVDQAKSLYTISSSKFVIYVHYSDVSWADFSNHWKIDSWFNRLLHLITKKISKVFITGPLWGESTGFPLQMASNAKLLLAQLEKHSHVITSYQAIIDAVQQLMSKNVILEIRRDWLAMHRNAILDDVVWRNFNCQL